MTKIFETPLVKALPKATAKVHMEELWSILSSKRPAASHHEKLMIQRHIDVIEGMKSDSYGNRWIIVGKDSETMFSCHTDTVHKSTGTQQPLLDHQGHCFIEKDCLGADDGAGVWIMLQMIKADVPGLYVFHREEEIGGRGSAHFVKENEEDLKLYKRCVAFDRKGYDDIIAFQGSGKCCSEEFTIDLALKLAEFDEVFDFESSQLGSFTDSANYTHVIRECTNLSVGYFWQHSVNEYLDCPFVKRLCQACIEIDWESLCTVKEVDTDTYSYDTTNYGGYRGGGRYRRKNRYTPPTNPTIVQPPTKIVEPPKSYIDPYIYDEYNHLDGHPYMGGGFNFIPEDDLSMYEAAKLGDYQLVVELVKSDPETAATLFLDMYDIDNIKWDMDVVDDTH